MQYIAAPVLFLLATTIHVIRGQSVHVVNVGDTGSFYDPPTVSALKGDIVSFRFSGTVHTVVQSTFEKPCLPLFGGFDSGPAGTPSQTVAPIPEWNLTITDDTHPIWFHCKFTQPVPHCTAGMVGAINAVTAGTNQSYELFVKAAKSLTTVPPVTATVPLLSGIGAIATAAPIPRNGTNVTAVATSTSNQSSSTDSSTSTSSPTSDLAPTQTQTQASASTGMTTAEKGGIAGGVVGGVIVLILVVLLFMSLRRGQRLRRDAAAIQHTFQSNNASRDMMHLGGRSGIIDVSAANSSRIGVNHLGYNRSPGSVSDSMENENKTMTAPSVSIKDLAAEVASFMRQESRSAAGAGEVARRRPPDAGDSLPTVRERAGTDARAPARTESTRTARQLPRPPASRGENTYSVDTLPEYVIGHGRHG